MLCYLILVYLIRLSFTEFSNRPIKAKPPSKPSFGKIPSLCLYRIVGFHAMECCKQRAKFIGLVSCIMSSYACLKHLLIVIIVFGSNAEVFF